MPCFLIPLLTDSFLSSGQPIRTKLNLPDRSVSTLQSCTFFFVYLEKTGMTVHRKWDKLTINAPPLGRPRVKDCRWLGTGDGCKRVEGWERIGLTLYVATKQDQKKSKRPATMGRPSLVKCSLVLDQCNAAIVTNCSAVSSIFNVAQLNAIKLMHRKQLSSQVGASVISTE